MAIITSAEEKSIQKYFEEEGIRFLYQERKVPLKDAVKRYLLPDFYLPDYEVFVDYLNGWDDPKQRPRLVDRIDLVKQNKLQVLFFYPKDIQKFRQSFPLRLNLILDIRENEKNEKKQLGFHTWLSVLCIILGSLFTYKPATYVLGLIAAAYGVLLFLLIHWKGIGAGSKKTVNVIWKGTCWVVIHIIKSIWWVILQLWYGVRWIFRSCWRIFRWIVIKINRFLRLFVKGVAVLIVLIIRGIHKLFSAVGILAAFTGYFIGQKVKRAGSSGSNWLQQVKKKNREVRMRNKVILPVKPFKMQIKKKNKIQQRIKKI